MLSDLTVVGDGRAGRDWPRPHLSPIVLWAGVIAYSIIILLGARLLSDADTFLHVAAGEWMGAHRMVPRVDPLSLTRAGAPWTAHEWLSELLLAGAYSSGGWAGVVMLTALAVGASFSILACALRRNLATGGVAVMLAASFLLLAPHLTARPHILAMPFMVGWTAVLDRARSRDTAPPYWALLLLIAWANLHGSFLLAIALAAGFGLDAVLSSFGGGRKAQARAWGIFIAAAIPVSLLGPLGAAGWRFPFALVDMHYALSLVGEWRPTDFSRFQPLEVWLLGLMAAGFAGLVRLKPARLAMLIGLFHLALSHARFSDQVAMLGPIIMGPSLAPVFDAAEGQPSPPRPWHLWFALAAVIGFSVFGMTRRVENQDPRIAPVQAAAKLGQGAIFNDYNFGNYLIFVGRAPFVDGRLDIYGDDFMRRYMSALNGNGDVFAELVRRYHLRWAILAPDRPAAAMLQHTAGWRRVYADQAAVVFVNDLAPGRDRRTSGSLPFP